MFSVYHYELEANRYIILISNFIDNETDNLEVEMA